MRFRFAAVSLTVLALAMPTPAAADEFNARIKAGTIQGIKSGPVFGTFAISGNHGFTLSATFDGANTEALCEPCQPGETISMSSLISIADGTGTFRGQTWQFNFNSGGGFFRLQGPTLTLPPGEGTEPATVEFETPFSVQEATLFLQGGENGEIQHFLHLTGSGTASARYQVMFDEFLQTHLYSLESIRFEFSRKKPLPPAPDDPNRFRTRIKGGTIQQAGLQGTTTTAIVGGHGFVFNQAFDGGGPSEASCFPCEPGQIISLSGGTGTGNGTAIYRGRTYVFDINSGGGSILLEGPAFTLPPGTGTEPTFVRFETPFSVADGSVLILQSGANGEIQQPLTLTGSGTATLQLQVTYDAELQTHLYWYQSIRYEFSTKKQKSNE